MPIFKNQEGKLKKLSVIQVGKEKELQDLVEANMEEVLDMRFLATEYKTTFGGRIDSLAVDYNGAPVIIEYKRNRNDNVINQALSYLKWLKAQKKEFFEMLVLKKLGKDFSQGTSIDWKNPRVICIAESYSKFDIDTVEVIPMRIELFKYRYYDRGIFSLEPLGLSGQNKKSVKMPPNGKTDTDNSVDKLLKKADPEIEELFGELQTKILEIDENIEEKATSLYVVYRVTKNFCEMHIGKKQLKIILRPIDYDDPKGLVDQVPKSYKWTLDKRVILTSLDDLEYALGLIEQSYKDVL